ncbi:hypothetical protein FKM82_007837 [Ascaphus truei]
MVPRSIVILLFCLRWGFQRSFLLPLSENPRARQAVTAAR